MNIGTSYKRHGIEGDYDAIVIGSGIGGLVSAALLEPRRSESSRARTSLYRRWLHTYSSEKASNGMSVFIISVTLCIPKMNFERFLMM